MMKEFKGEVVYNQEVDKHFPHLTVGQTLEFAASTRTPSHRIRGLSRKQFSEHTAKVIMAIFGLSHTYNTKVGSDFVRGVSGGERKRVSIAEMALSGSPLAAWDNSTRGLDSATAFKFVDSLRTLANLGGSAHAVAIYQASQQIYDLFDKAIVLYEGRTIYYGPASKARAFFEKQGWTCDKRQTTGDFLTGLTNPAERKAREGMENKVPRTAEDFERLWLESSAYKDMQRGIEEHEKSVSGEETIQSFRDNKGEFQANHTRLKSPYMISIPMQIKLNTKRSYQRVWNDLPSTTAAIGVNVFMSLIIGSIFYGTPDGTVSFFSKGAVLFFAVLLNALQAMNEINSLYAQRPIVEKHKSYAFYHPATEAIAGIVSDVPVKFVTSTVFDVILYFLAGLRREPSQFFIFFLITFVIGQIMSAVFRSLAAITKTISQAMTLAGVMVLALVIYTGYVLPQPYMKPWFDWIHYLNPIYYAFEILIANEFHGREFPCSNLIPNYLNMAPNTFICSMTGALQGQYVVQGDRYISTAYEYTYSHVWRNFGIMIGFLIGFMIIYFIAVELNSSTSSTAEVLVFRQGHAPASLTGKVKEGNNDEEAAPAQGAASNDHTEGEVDAIPAQKDIFTWRNVVYDIKIKGEPRRLLDHVSGYVKPGTLTALMGVSGAGKTTLLDSLAQRTTMGVITGDMLVNGKPIDASFQRGCGYVQQQDLHLETATVRESLQFSAMLRQPKSVSKKEKYDYVEEVIKMLDMEDFAEAVVGVPGQGLNVEQRKLLTIGVELAAKPKLLLFLDEPTSGLDSQSAWAICAFLRKLADAGQAVLCTIHQPSAVLFQEFDRLLFLAKGGKTVYFGEIGENSRTLLDYFEANGARHCEDDENPAEFMLEIVNAGSQGQGPDWHEVWKKSDEAKDVQKQIDQLHEESSGRAREREPTKEELSEFAMPLTSQIWVVTHRVFQQYWRMPQYILAKWTLGTAAGLFIGFSFFKSNNSTQGMQNVIFSAFMVCTIFSSLV
ncbi:putative ABC multidrug transporter, partial [Aureobasidium melanogenum]